jgi:hypothetical protein
VVPAVELLAVAWPAETVSSRGACSLVQANLCLGLGRVVVLPTLLRGAARRKAPTRARGTPWHPSAKRRRRTRPPHCRSRASGRPSFGSCCPPLPATRWSLLKVDRRPATRHGWRSLEPLRLRAPPRGRPSSWAHARPAGRPVGSMAELGDLQPAGAPPGEQAGTPSRRGGLQRLVARVLLRLQARPRAAGTAAGRTLHPHRTHHHHHAPQRLFHHLRVIWASFGRRFRRTRRTPTPKDGLLLLRARGGG